MAKQLSARDRSAFSEVVHLRHLTLQRGGARLAGKARALPRERPSPSGERSSATLIAGRGWPLSSDARSGSSDRARSSPPTRSSLRPRGGLRRAVSLDDHVRDGNIELVAQSVDDARLEPIRFSAGVGGDDHLVGAMLAELVLDRANAAFGSPTLPVTARPSARAQASAVERRSRASSSSLSTSEAR